MMSFGTAIATLLLLVAAGRAQADEAQPDRVAASSAYDRGTAAYLSGNYAQAGGWFETAHRLAPAPAALQQAIKAHLRAGDEARAATLALEMQRQYAEQPEFRKYGQDVVENAAPNLLRVEVHCAGCELAIDGKVQLSSSFFVRPDRPHILSATFRNGGVNRELRGEAGETLQVTLKPPAPEPQAAADVVRTPFRDGLGLSRDDGSEKPLRPLATYIAIGITVAFGAATTLSGLATKRLGHSYDAAVAELNAADCGASAVANVNRCASLYDNAEDWLRRGEAAETRTNILLGTTVVSAAATAVIAMLLTEWDSPDANKAEAAMSVSPGETAHGTLAVRF